MRPRRGLLVGCAFATAAAALAAACRLTEGLTGGEAPDDGGDDAADEASNDGGVACGANLSTSVENCGACGAACPSGPNSYPTCTDGGCGLACASGFGNCDDAASNGCETNLLNTRTSCGRCGHDCMGGVCASAQCQPFALATTANAPAHIVADDAYIYGISAHGAVTRVAKDAGAGSLSVLVPGDTATRPVLPRIALGSGALYYTSFGDAGAPDAAPIGTISTVLLDGGGASVLASTVAPFAIAATPTNVYWSQGNPNDPAPTGAIMSCVIANCASSVVAVSAPENGRISSIVADTSSVTWANQGTPPAMKDGAVRRCDPSGCHTLATYTPPSTTTFGPFAVTADATTTFWTANRDIGSCLSAGCSGLPSSVDNNLLYNQPRFLTLDATSVFWTNADGWVISVPKTGPAGAEHPLYRAKGTSPWDIVVDANAVYWTDTLASAPALYRLAR